MRPGFADRSMVFVVALSVVVASPARAQYAAAANVGATIPFTIGSVRIDAIGGIDRHMSWIAPRTVVAVGADASTTWPSSGATLGFAAQRSAEFDSPSPVLTIHGGYWRRLGALTLGLDVAAHAVRFDGQAGGTSITDHWIDSVGSAPAGGGFPDTLAHYRVLHADTVVLPSTPSRLAQWSEVQATAAVTVGRVRFDALVGARPSVGAFPRAVWGHVGGALQVRSGLAVVAAAGVAPTRIGLGIPASRYLSLGLSLVPHGSGPQAPRKPVREPSRFAIRPLGERRFVVSYVIERADSVDVSGDFDGWTPIALDPAGGDRWTTTVTLAPGVYHISVRVNGGPWSAPPGTTPVADDFGGTSGIVVIP